MLVYSHTDCLLKDNGLVFHQAGPEVSITHPAIRTTCKQIGRLAGERFKESKNILRQCDRKIVRPAIVMMTVYQHLFNELCKNDWKYPFKKVTISTTQKLYLIIKEQLLSQLQ